MYSINEWGEGEEEDSDNDDEGSGGMGWSTLPAVQQYRTIAVPVTAAYD